VVAPEKAPDGALSQPPRNRYLDHLHHAFRASAMRTKITVLYVLLAGGNLLAWAWEFIALHDYPVLLGTAFLAYTFGLRHAVDADHIAAVDNVTRKLVQEGERPTAVGFFFSLGHSTVVVVASAAIALAAGALKDDFVSFRARRGEADF
jgi:nickel/cobalt transporter (NiCoT) family protein